jgi:hypothetical protein
MRLLLIEDLQRLQLAIPQELAVFTDREKLSLIPSNLLAKRPSSTPAISRSACSARPLRSPSRQRILHM